MAAFLITAHIDGLLLGDRLAATAAFCFTLGKAISPRAEAIPPIAYNAAMDALKIEADADAEASSAAPPSPTGTSRKTYTFAQMRIKVGDQLSLEPPSQIAGGRANVMVLGWFEGKSLIVTAPQSNAGRLVLEQGEVVLIRAFTGRSAFAFRVTVEKTAQLPYHHLHLSFPEKAEGVDVRSSPRCRLLLSAVITGDGAAARQGTILNLGTAGALIETTTPLGEAASTIQIAFSFELHGVPVSLDLRAKLRGKKSAAGTNAAHCYQYGVEFSNLQPNDRLMLGSLVWYEMYEHPQNVV